MYSRKCCENVWIKNFGNLFRWTIFQLISLIFCFHFQNFIFCREMCKWEWNTLSASALIFDLNIGHTRWMVKPRNYLGFERHFHCVAREKSFSANNVHCRSQKSKSILKKILAPKIFFIKYLTTKMSRTFLPEYNSIHVLMGFFHCRFDNQHLLELVRISVGD